MSADGPLAYYCEYCDADPGQPCVNVWTKQRRDEPHVTRTGEAMRDGWRPDHDSLSVRFEQLEGLIGSLGTDILKIPVEDATHVQSAFNRLANVAELVKLLRAQVLK